MWLAQGVLVVVVYLSQSEVSTVCVYICMICDRHGNVNFFFLSPCAFPPKGALGYTYIQYIYTYTAGTTGPADLRVTRSYISMPRMNRVYTYKARRGAKEKENV